MNPPPCTCRYSAYHNIYPTKSANIMAWLYTEYDVAWNSQVSHWNFSIPHATSCSTSKFCKFMSPPCFFCLFFLTLNYHKITPNSNSHLFSEGIKHKEKNDLRNISKPYTHLQTMTKIPVKFQKDRHKSIYRSSCAHKVPTIYTLW